MPTPINILIVDDRQENIIALEALLDRNDIKIFPTVSPNEALKIAWENNIAIALVDVQMPEMTGVELHRHLIDAGYAIPTILVTAYPDETAGKRALKDGVVCYLPKPVDDEHLERCLRAALESGTANGRIYEPSWPAGRVN